MGSLLADFFDTLWLRLSTMGQLLEDFVRNFSNFLAAFWLGLQNRWEWLGTELAINWDSFYVLLLEDTIVIGQWIRDVWNGFFLFLWISLSSLWPAAGNVWQRIVSELQGPQGPIYIGALSKIIGGFFLARAARLLVTSVFGKHMTPQQLMLLRRTVYYLIFTLFVVSALDDLGFDFGILLTAGGILTVAIGFASQTSASNIISGLFLIGERAFEIDDIVEIDGTMGIVLAVDLLSTKIRTFDNLVVRVPNETMIKTKLINYSRLPIRRVDIRVGVAFKENLEQVRKLLFSVADANPLCLEEPEPLFIFIGFGNSSLDLQFSVWATRQNWLELKNKLQQEIKEAFDNEGIEIPFPHLTLYTGAATEPFPLRNLSLEAQEQRLREADEHQRRQEESLLLDDEALEAQERRKDKPKEEVDVFT